MRRRTFLTLPGMGLPMLASAQQFGATGRVMVGFAAGGAGDFVARTVAEHLRSRNFAPSVIVDNRPGVGGVLAVQALKGSIADGLTLLNTPASVLTILPHTHKKLPFDSLQDVTPIATLSDLDFAVVAGAATPAKTLQELIALAKRDPAMAVFGTAGVGTMSHVVGVQLGRRAGVNLVHVPYRGGAPVLQDAMGGQVPIAILALSDLLLRGHQEGRIRVLATSGTKRTRFLPEVPTIEEAGYKGVGASDWNTIVAPPKTPPQVVERLSRLVMEITADPAFATTIGKFCLEPLRLNHEQFAARLKAEYEAMGRFVKEERITIDS